MSETPREDAYDDKIAPLMSQIIALCREHEIPLVASFELDDDGQVDPPDPMRCTTICGPKPISRAMLEAERVLRPTKASSFAITETIITDPKTGNRTIRIGLV